MSNIMELIIYNLNNLIRGYFVEVFNSRHINSCDVNERCAPRSGLMCGACLRQFNLRPVLLLCLLCPLRPISFDHNASQQPSRATNTNQNNK